MLLSAKLFYVINLSKIDDYANLVISAGEVSVSSPSQLSELCISIKSDINSDSVLPMSPPFPFSGPNTGWL